MALLIMATWGGIPYAHAQTAPTLGSASTFAILAGAGFTIAGTGTVITGDVGSSPIATCVGLPSPCSGSGPGTLTGTIYLDTGTGTAATAQSGFPAAYTTATGQEGSATAVAAGGGGLDVLQVSEGGSLPPGVYFSASTLELTNTLNLACATSNSVFILIAGSAITLATTSNVVVTGGCDLNVFWVDDTGATLNGATFVGTVLDNTGGITVGTGAAVSGMFWSHTGAITMAGTAIITNPRFTPPTTVPDFPMGILVLAVPILAIYLFMTRRGNSLGARTPLTDS